MYCSRALSAANLTRHERMCPKNEKNQRVCPVCQKMFSVDAGQHNQVTCSHGCSNTHFRSGPNNGNWKTDTYATTCFYYHEKKCVVCPETNIVEAHHLNGQKTDSRPENLVPLCPTHHQYWHSRFRELVEPQVLEYMAHWIQTRIGVVGQPG